MLRPLALCCLASLLTPPALAQCEEPPVFLEDGVFADEFGDSLDIDGGQVLVGAPGRGVAGAAVLIDLATGQVLMELVPPDGVAGDEFGAAVALSGSRMVVGAPRHQPLGGAAYLFDRSTGLQIAKLTANDGELGDSFGRSVSTDGELVLVGARGASDLGLASGAAFLFNANTGAILYKLLPSDGDSLDGFGAAVALDGERALISAPTQTAGPPSTGAVYVFDPDSGNELLKLVASDAEAYWGFGDAVALDGTLGVVGAPNADGLGSASGAAYLFDLESGQELFKWIPSQGGLFDDFGASVAIDGPCALVGAPRDRQAGSNAGSATLFDTDTGLELDHLVPASASDGDFFGTGVALQQPWATLGAPSFLASSGEVAVYDVECGIHPDFSAVPSTGEAPLLVSFQDLSDATPAASGWAWEFGDGATSSLQNPSHSYKLPGTYDVCLTVSNEVSVESAEKLALVVVLDGPAAATKDNGIGINPDVFSSTSSPVLGGIWTSSVDGGAVGSDSGLSFVFGYFGSLEPGTLLGVGELLVDPSAPFALLNVSLLVSGLASHSENVPDDPTLSGICVTTQGFLNQTPGGTGQLTNAIVLRFGLF